MNESSVEIQRITKEALKLMDQIARSVDGYIDGVKLRRLEAAALCYDLRQG